MVFVSDFIQISCHRLEKQISENIIIILNLHIIFFDFSHTMIIYVKKKNLLIS
jgi:hypothetical protein